MLFVSLVESGKEKINKYSVAYYGLVLQRKKRVEKIITTTGARITLLYSL
jgi:hypothetical protein